MSHRRSMACGGAPQKGGEAFESCREIAGARSGYFIVIGRPEKTRRWPSGADRGAIRAGTCLSNVWTCARVQDCLQRLSGWHLQTVLPVQQQVFPASDVPAAHAG